MIAESAAERKRIFDRFEPLPQRSARNRRRLYIYLVLYATLSSALVACALVVGVYLALLIVALKSVDSDLLISMGSFTKGLPVIIGGVWLVCMPIFGVWCLRAMRRSEVELLGQLRAVPVRLGECSRAKSALHEAVIASGMPMPRLALISDSSINAFVIARSAETAWIGVTSGLLDSLSQDELRCVFAHLVARIRDGSACTATVLAKLFDAVSEVGRAGDKMWEEYSLDTADTTSRSSRLTSASAIFYLVMRGCLGISSVAILFGYKRAQAIAAESADSEAMLITKDPKGMLGALRKVLPADNRPGTIWDPRLREDVFGALFFAWPTFSVADDPELVRIQRMREVLGAAGA